VKPVLYHDQKVELARSEVTGSVSEG